MTNASEAHNRQRSDAAQRTSAGPAASAGVRHPQGGKNALRLQLYGTAILLVVSVLWGSSAPSLRFLFILPSPPSAALVTAAVSVLSSAFLVVGVLGAAMETDKSASGHDPSTHPRPPGHGQAQAQGAASGQEEEEYGGGGAAGGGGRSSRDGGSLGGWVGGGAAVALPGAAWYRGEGEGEGELSGEGLGIGVREEEVERRPLLGERVGHTTVTLGASGLVCSAGGSPLRGGAAAAAGTRGTGGGAGSSGAYTRPRQSFDGVCSPQRAAASRRELPPFPSAAPPALGSTALASSTVPFVPRSPLRTVQHKPQHANGSSTPAHATPRHPPSPFSASSAPGSPSRPQPSAPTPPHPTPNPLTPALGLIRALLTRPARTLPAAGLELGLYNFAAAALGAWGVQRLSATKTAFLSQATSLITPVLVALSGAHVSGVVWVACGAGAAGGAMVALDSVRGAAGGGGGGGEGAGVGQAPDSAMAVVAWVQDPSPRILAADPTILSATASAVETAHLGTATAASLSASAPLSSAGGGVLGPQQLLGLYFTLASCFFWSLSTVRLGVHARRLGPLRLATASMLCYSGLALGWLTAEVLGSPGGARSDYSALMRVLHNHTALALLLWAGLGPGALSTYLQSLGQTMVSAARAQVVYSTIPLWSALLAQLLLPGEAMGALAWAGGAVMLGASLLASVLH